MESLINDIRAGKYENKMEFKYVPVPVDEDVMTVKQAREHRAVQKEEDQKHRLAYREEEYRLQRLFRNDLEAYYGTANYPRKDKLFDLAWSRRHSSGYEQVVYEYDELADLVKP